MGRFEITLQSVDPVDLGDLGAAGFEGLVRSAGVDTAFTWEQDADGRVSVTFRHEATDEERAQGASDRIASELGPAVWTVQVHDLAAG